MAACRSSGYLYIMIQEDEDKTQYNTEIAVGCWVFGVNGSLLYRHCYR